MGNARRLTQAHMPRLILTSQAVDDLERVQQTLANKSQSAAERARQVIVEHLEKVQRHPTIYRPVPDRPYERDIVIAFGSHGYVLRYRYEQGADRVVILRVWHQREQQS